MKELFWLHIRKSGGSSTRELLKPYYHEVDRGKLPGTFVQSEWCEYNDILNNYRIPLGEYTFKRCQFAQKFLYKDRWSGMVSFALSREPISRAVSMFHYLYWKDLGVLLNVQRALNRLINEKKVVFNARYAFDLFIEAVEACHRKESLYKPLGLEFSTHVATMHEDITDEEGNILLTHVIRLENMTDGINSIFKECGIEKRLDFDLVAKQTNNEFSGGKKYRPNQAQLNRLHRIYGRDFEIYENARN